MALKAFCNNCEAELPVDSNHLAIPDMVMVHNKNGTRLQQTHFCNPVCFTNFIENTKNAPKLIIPEKGMIQKQ